MKSSFFAGVLALALALAAAAPARAEEDPEALIKQGNVLRKSGDDAKAHGYFQRAYDIAHTARSSAQLGLVELALKQWAESANHFQEALAARTDPWIRSNRKILEQSLTRAKTQAAGIQIAGTPAGAEVSVNGKVVGQLPLPAIQFVSPGAVELGFTAPGHRYIARSVEVPAGQVFKMELKLDPLPVATASPALSPTVTPKAAPLARAVRQTTFAPSLGPVAVHEGPSGTWMRPAAWGAGAVAVVFAGVGTYLALRSDSLLTKFNDYKAPNPDGSCASALPDAGGGDCARLLNDGNTARQSAIVSFVGAGISAGASAFLFVLAPSAGDSAGKAKVAACLPAVNVAGGLGLGCVGRF